MPGFARTEVRRHNGVPTIVVDGRPIHGMTATSCAFHDPAVVRAFVDGGVELMMIWIEAGIHCWKGEGRYDWTYAEEKLRFFEEHAGDTRWIIRVRLGLVAHWFAEAYPGEVHNRPGRDGRPDGDLAVANIASSVWCAKACELVDAFVRWLSTTRWAPRIAGFMLNAGATEEWLVFDTDELVRGRYHEAYTREFGRWLRERYAGDLEALRDAWSGTAGDIGNHPRARAGGVTFENASGPTGHTRKGSHIWGPFSLRDPVADRQAIDWYAFLNETLADHLIALCRAAKEAAGSPVICGGFHSYLWWESGVYSYIQEYGHACLQRLKASPWVDFVSDITSYDGRYPGGPSGYLGLPHSLNVSGKLHYTEVDLVTVNQLPGEYREAWSRLDPATVPPRTTGGAIPDRTWMWDLNYCGRDLDEQVAVLQREHAHNLITGTPYWWFDIRTYDYAAPGIVGAMKKLSDIGRDAVGRDRSSASEVAFVLSERTPLYQAAMSGELLRFELESNHALLLDGCTKRWGLAGVPFDVYEIEDLAHDGFPGDQYRLLIFVNCAAVSERGAAGVRRWMSNGRVHCWTYAAAVTGDDGIDPARGCDLVGMRLGWRNERRTIRVTIGPSDHTLARGEGLSFGTEGSVGPVFYADDPAATVLGRLRDGGEPAFAVREHATWRSVYLAMTNFGPALVRNLARYAGARVWCESDDVLYANRSMVCLHTASAGRKTVALPAPAVVTDLWTGERTDGPVERIEADMSAYRTKIWGLSDAR